jgi:sugar lactone lactonase YvrE
MITSRDSTESTAHPSPPITAPATTQPEPPSTPAVPPPDDRTTITTFAGTGAEGFSGDGGPATQATLDAPYGATVDTAGNIYVPDFSNNRIRRIDPQGTITTVAGTGAKGFSGDGGPATQASLNSPTAVALDNAGNLYIADTFNHRIRRVDPQGIITTIAGNDRSNINNITSAERGAAVPAVELSLWYPVGLATDAAGNVYLADSANNLVRRVDPQGLITTVVGITVVMGVGAEGSFGDGGPAVDALVDNPFSLAVDGAGNLYIADQDSHRIRRVDPAGTITTVAGTGVAGFSGDGGPATEAQITAPRGVAVDAAGNIYITDLYSSRIRRVDTAGIITTVAGNGQTGSTGDGGPATLATFESLDGPVAVDGAGNIYVADKGANRVRVVRPNG